MSSATASVVGGSVSGRIETTSSSFLLRASILLMAVSANEWRAEVSDSIIGSAMYLLVPYVRVARPEMA